MTPGKPVVQKDWLGPAWDPFAQKTGVKQKEPRMINKMRLSLILCVASQTAWAGPRERAKQLHDRIAGVPPSAETLDMMESLIASGDFEAAAQIPLNSEEFLRITVK